jgi:hypothetical protein
LQADAERSDEKHMAELGQQRKSMENVIIGLKEEETRLKDKVTELTRVSRIFDYLLSIYLSILLQLYNPFGSSADYVV